MRKLPSNNERTNRRVKERSMMRQLDPYNLGIYNK
jgi:hypothetical protein